MQDTGAEENKNIDIDNEAIKPEAAEEKDCGCGGSCGNEQQCEESAEEKSAAALAEEKYLRLYADFDNYRRRAAKERLETYSMATGDLLVKLLPVLDNFSRAMDSCDETDSPFYSGIKMVYKQLDDILREAGLEKIEALGSEFNPECHFAVVTESSEDADDNIVTKELQSGYSFKGKVLRAAMVAVNQK